MSTGNRSEQDYVVAIDGTAILRAGKADVRAALGSRADTRAIESLWKYDDTEITFHEGDATMIAVPFAVEAEAVRRRLDDEALP